ncbi:phosphopantetheine-binding protein [Ancylobacter sonchi]|uniref:phosphopantetheine-binding protein n=1 Tax=Ancylobacter sonchi TaxID=1937790 RepID=UPI001BD670A7|nr:phosphopantetheine-binding protein [Ancylobacter sonchi]MBS7533111.1 phosphopantetheine-binding protein [Ancylobacter sonchi]
MIDPTEIRRLAEPRESLTMDGMRRDIAAMLHEDPSEIGEADSLLDLGLDSMRAMNLVLGWSEGGLDLEFSEFAEDPTLAGWWTIVARQQAQRG